MPLTVQFLGFFCPFVYLLSSFVVVFTVSFVSLELILCGCVSFIGWWVARPQIPLEVATISFVSLELVLFGCVYKCP